MNNRNKGSSGSNNFIKINKCDSGFPSPYGKKRQERDKSEMDNKSVRKIEEYSDLNMHQPQNFYQFSMPPIASNYVSNFEISNISGNKPPHLHSREYQ